MNHSPSMNHNTVADRRHDDAHGKKEKMLPLFSTTFILVICDWDKFGISEEDKGDICPYGKYIPLSLRLSSTPRRLLGNPKLVLTRQPYLVEPLKRNCFLQTSTSIKREKRLKKTLKRKKRSDSQAQIL